MDGVELLKTAILGVVEGLTEFLPVSSTGHLILASHLLGVAGESNKVFEVVIQTGAILAVCWLYRARLFKVATGLHNDASARAFVRNVALAFLPTAVVGALLHDFIKTVLFSPWVVPVSLILGGIAILIIEARHGPDAAEEAEEAPSRIGARMAFAIGLCQLLALVPGVSRAGATILGAVALGVPRREATEFSFFLAIPTMFGAASYDLYSSWKTVDAHDALTIAVGVVTSFVSALIVIKWLIGFVGHHRFTIFAWYRIALGVIALPLLVAGLHA